jgi:hypothetical protein
MLVGLLSAADEGAEAASFKEDEQMAQWIDEKVESVTRTKRAVDEVLNLVRRPSAGSRRRSST